MIRDGRDEAKRYIRLNQAGVNDRVFYVFLAALYTSCAREFVLLVERGDRA